MEETNRGEGRALLRRKRAMILTSARKGRRTDGVLVTCGKMIDGFEELDTAIDVAV